VLLLQHLSLLLVHITIIPGLVSLRFNIHIKQKTKNITINALLGGEDVR